MNEREDYLDRLLRGMDGESENKDAEDDFFSELGRVSQEAEDDFLKEFEKSRAQRNNTSELEQDEGMDDIDQIMNHVKNSGLEEMEEFEALRMGQICLLMSLFRIIQR